MEFENKKLNELRSLCKEYNVQSSGTKQNLIKRLKKSKFLQKQNKLKPIHCTIYNDSSFQFIDSYKKIYSFLVSKDSKRVYGKLNNQTNQVEELDKEDLDFCKYNSIPIVIPLFIRGKKESHRIRTYVEEDEEEEDEMQDEINDLNT